MEIHFQARHVCVRADCKLARAWIPNKTKIKKSRKAFDSSNARNFAETERERLIFLVLFRTGHELHTDSLSGSVFTAKIRGIRSAAKRT